MKVLLIKFSKTNYQGILVIVIVIVIVTVQGLL
jgi:hypothetical protein